MKEVTFNDTKFFFVCIVIVILFALLLYAYCTLLISHIKIEEYIRRIRQNYLLYLICEVQQTNMLNQNLYNKKIEKVVEYMHNHNLTNINEVFDYKKAVYQLYLHGNSLGQELYKNKR